MHDLYSRKTDGTVDVVFTFDANSIAGETVVAFESLSYKDVELTTHTDINDESQTVYLPEIHTSTVDAETGIKNTYRDGHMTIVDTVTYKNLIPGNTLHTERCSAGEDHQRGWNGRVKSGNCKACRSGCKSRG
ncbi:MAG: VaFE repeat-containing surface-anchored protein [Lachnospiraceae bacterium]